MVANAYLRVNDPAVQSFLLPGQPVYEDIWKVSQETGMIARTVEAPSRSGKLRRNIQANRPERTGVWKNTALVFVKVGYGHYVHEGTLDRPPRPKNGTYMTIPRNHRSSVVSGGKLRTQWRSGGKQEFPGGRPYFTATHIRGQAANPFLARALHKAMPR